ncbi:hypothetical protein [Tenacibaculum finnmarkense]|uniref:hypothetical protein n=1 Tax=Tenacibaculum finnmarkense TaxID=2781243 RepID=UPI000C602668|nr:hypothetical protein [Tenacibaculum finnmarkense]MCD8440809.1 hypothetical protein [Tenacibaculum finnmarkense genomovar ulcerans]MCG8721722.1 hypothetical protein [Tenacibaculum finnmarkense]SOS55836.1 conserved hypothetical protein [Tenacibaculum finnmarkense]
MGLNIKILDRGPRTFAEFKARLAAQDLASTGNFTTVVNNANTTVEDRTNNKIKTITVFDKEDKKIGYSEKYNEACTAKAQEETWYKVGLDELDCDTLEKDLRKVKFCFWVQDHPKGKMMVIDNPKKVIMIRKKSNPFTKDSTTDILETKNTETLTKNLEKAYYYAVIEYTEKEAILKIKWSKWLDGYFIRVEACFRRVNIKADGGKTTASRYLQSSPEIVKGYWVNDKRNNITNKIVGYKDIVYMCLKTLGMKNKNLTAELWEDDYGYGDEQIEIENAAFEIKGRYTYKKLEIPDSVNENYQKKRGGIEGDQLELYFKLPQEKNTTGYKTGFGNSLNIISKEKITNAYFSLEKKRNQIQDSTLPEPEQTPNIHIVGVSKETINKIAKTYGLDAGKLAKLNNVEENKGLTYGGVPIKLKTTAEIAANEKAKKARATKQEKAKTEPYYEPISTASLGSEVWLVVESANLRGKKATIEIYDKEALLAEDKKPITVLKDDTEVTKLENVTFDDNGQAKVKIKLRKKSDADYKKQKDKFKDDKIAKLFLKVTCKVDAKRILIKEFLVDKEFDIYEPIHTYNVNISTSKIEKILNPGIEIKEYRFLIFKNKKKIASHDMLINKHKLLGFPKSGSNWGRYGSRDKGGDNWIDEETAAAFLGFLYSLPENNISETLYYNDISANDKRNIGHKSHRTGKDIDIRYPGADNSAGEKLWGVSKEVYVTEEKFVKKLEDILDVAVKWNFIKKHNYAYKKDIKNTKGSAVSVHQNHFHIGYKR